MKTKQPANFLSFFRTPVFLFLNFFSLEKEFAIPSLSVPKSPQVHPPRRQTRKEKRAKTPSPPPLRLLSLSSSLQVEINISHRAGGSGSDSTTKLFPEKKRQQNIAFFFVPFPPFHSRKVPYFLVSLSSGMYVLLCSLVLLLPPPSRVTHVQHTRCEMQGGKKARVSMNQHRRGREGSLARRSNLPNVEHPPSCI